MIDNKKRKIIILIVSLVFIFGILVSYPSLAKFKNRNTIYTTPTWDGTVATSYKTGDGSIDDPYIISNSSEFAFFIEQLKTVDYEGIYFELGADIVLNYGLFDYNSSDGLKYIIDDKTYYIKEYTNEYYDNPTLIGEPIGQVNSISPIKSFKGNLNGKSFTIFGMYITSSVESELALFENISGIIKDLYITNSSVYGLGKVSGVAVNSENATISNLIYDGYVVNKATSKFNENNLEDLPVTLSSLETVTELELPEVLITDEIKSIKLLGKYEIVEVGENVSSNTIKINDTDISSNFVVDLGTTLNDNISILTSSTVDGTVINFYDLKYKIEYCDDIATGIISNAIDTTLLNVVNKADIYGNYVSAGFVGSVKGNFVLKRSYNTGNIKSVDISSGLVGLLKNNESTIEFSNVYNKGEITGNTPAAFISIASENIGIIDIFNSFNTSSNYVINTVCNSVININKSYSVNDVMVYNGTLNGEFSKVELENLYNEQTLSQNSFNKFISFDDVEENLDNAWIYEKNSLPILYIDDLNNPIVSININKYRWDNLSTELSTINLTSNLTFTIENESVVDQVKEKYYYIGTSDKVLTENDLQNMMEWIPYTDAVTIENSGYYIIYSKVVDMDGKASYINTDIISFDVNGFKTSINLDDVKWTTFKTNLEEKYVNKNIYITISATSDLITINSVQYYISDKELTEEEVNAVTEWADYNNSIVISETGKYVIYAKITDSNSNVTYMNTDYLLYNGYKEMLSIGTYNVDYETNYISNKSSITLNFESDFRFEFKEGYTHNLISNMLLPVGTSMTLIDKTTNKIYQKTITTQDDLYGYNDSCLNNDGCSKYATYSFNIFKQVGSSVYYDETLNYDKMLQNENFVIIIDFKNTSLIDNYYDLSFHLAIKDNNNEYLYETLDETKSNINIYSNLNSEEIETNHSLESDYIDQKLYYNSNSELVINFDNKVNYSVINNKNIIDTLYERKKTGIIIQLFNKKDERLNKKYLENMIFELNGVEHYSNSDNLIRINLGSVVDSQNKVLKIKTKENSSGLTNGEYYIKIDKYISDDGYYYESLYDDNIIIPLIVENQTISIPDYSFEVLMNDDSIILDNKNESHLVNFNINYFGEFVDPNIRISLYEKTSLTAYNQDYSLVDLSKYTDSELISADLNKYFVDVNNSIFNLNLLTNEFNNNGYKYVFELYDGLNMINKVEIYFIVK